MSSDSEDSDIVEVLKAPEVKSYDTNPTFRSRKICLENKKVKLQVDEGVKLPHEVKRVMIKV